MTKAQVRRVAYAIVVESIDHGHVGFLDAEGLSESDHQAVSEQITAIRTKLHVKSF